MRQLLILPLFAIACAAPDKGSVRIIGHGGSGTEGPDPMNSRMALLTGLEQGTDGIEMDVQLTSDKVLVAYHAEDLSELTECTGKINAHTWAELRYCPNTTGTEPYPIVRLDSLLHEAAFRFPNADFTLDCKLFAAGEWWPYLNTFSEAVITLGQEPALRGRLLVECQVVDFLQLVHDRSADIPVYLYATEAEAGIATAASRGYAGITIHNGLITAAQVTEAKKRGLAVTLFGVAAFGQGAALAKDPDRLQTDAPSGFAK